jgi:hypothetical protein
MQKMVPPVTAARAWLWAALTIVGLVVAFLAAFGVAVTVISWALFPDAGQGSLRLDLAGLLFLIGTFGTGALLAAGRVAFGSWLDVRPRQLIPPAAGVGVAIGVELALHQWAWLSIGSYDWDLIGWTAGLSFCVVLVAVAWFGVTVAPRGATAPPRIGLGLSALLVLLIVLSNVPGVGDGIGPQGWSLAILVGSAAIYAIGAVTTALRIGSPG